MSEEIIENASERGEYTSASSAQADALCVGRFLAQKGLPDTKSDDAAFGTAVHEALYKKSSDGLTVEQEDIYESCVKIEKKVIEAYFGAGVENMQEIRENRFWVHWPDKLRHSGQVDCAYRKGTKALIVEYKALPGQVPTSPNNLQLRDQVVVVNANTPLLAEIAVVVIQPLVTHTPEITVYSRDDIEKAGRILHERVRASNAGGKRTAGEVQCKFCKAKMQCGEYQSWAGSLVPAPKSLVDVPVREWTPEQRKQFCDTYSIAQKWLDNAWAAMEAGALMDADFVPGYSLVDGVAREKITNLQSIFDKASKYGVALEPFLNNSTISKKDLSEIVRSATKLKGKKLQECIDAIIGDDVQVSSVKKSLKQAKA